MKMKPQPRLSRSLMKTQIQRLIPCHHSLAVFPSLHTFLRLALITNHGVQLTLRRSSQLQISCTPSPTPFFLPLSFSQSLLSSSPSSGFPHESSAGTSAFASSSVWGTGSRGKPQGKYYWPTGAKDIWSIVHLVRSANSVTSQWKPLHLEEPCPKRYVVITSLSHASVDTLTALRGPVSFPSSQGSISGRPLDPGS